MVLRVENLEVFGLFILFVITRASILINIQKIIQKSTTGKNQLRYVLDNKTIKLILMIENFKFEM